jgi:hypothetical protein
VGQGSIPHPRVGSCTHATTHPCTHTHATAHTPPTHRTHTPSHSHPHTHTHTLTHTLPTSPRPSHSRKQPSPLHPRHARSLSMARSGVVSSPAYLALPPPTLGRSLEHKQTTSLRGGALWLRRCVAGVRALHALHRSCNVSRPVLCALLASCRAANSGVHACRGGRRRTGGQKRRRDGGDRGGHASSHVSGPEGAVLAPPPHACALASSRSKGTLRVSSASVLSSTGQMSDWCMCLGLVELLHGAGGVKCERCVAARAGA